MGPPFFEAQPPSWSACDMVRGADLVVVEDIEPELILSLLVMQLVRARWSCSSNEVA
jgi:hypothetical protein